MADMSWLNNPELKNITPKKLEIISNLAKNTDGKPIAQAIPFLMKANQELQKEGLTFTEKENALIMDILTRDMNEQEKQQVSRMTRLFNEKFKKNS